MIFDFGGVLIDWNPRYLFRSLFEDESQMEFFLTNICNGSWNLQQDKGRPFAEGVKLLQERFPKYKILIQTYYDKWETMIKSEIPENVNLMFRLKRKYKIFGLTNWSAETFPILLKKFPLFKEFDGIVVSGIEKMAKPNKDIYHVLLDRYQLQPSQSVFIDDTIDNIYTAKELGFHTIHHNNMKSLENRLIEMNII